MLTGVHVVILGGDARQLEVINKLNELDATLDIVGFDQLDRYYTGVTKIDVEDIQYDSVDAIVLPAGGTYDDGTIQTVFSNKSVRMTEEWLRQTPKHCTIYTGITTPYLKECAKACEREIVQLFERDDVAIYNSIPTVEGTLMIVIQNMDITIHQSKVVILGLGRTGYTMSRVFAALGANVCVGASRSESLARINEMGMVPFHIKELEDYVTDVDVCINTIPARILTGRILSKMPLHTLIVDIASHPGGTDFRYAEKRGIKAMHVLGIPAMVAPKTAGRIIGNVLSELLLEKYIEEDDIIES